MKIGFIADARSPTAQGWFRATAAATSARLAVLSTHPCDAGVVDADEFHEVPVAFSGLARRGRAAAAGYVLPAPRLRRGRALRDLVSRVRLALGPATIPAAAFRARRILERSRVDVVHGIQLAYGGFLAARAAGRRPVVVSTWGSDFTLYANRSMVMARLARDTLRRADALVCDCEADARRARERGFDDGRLLIVLPAVGGVDTRALSPGPRDRALLARLGIPAEKRIVLNPRGVRLYVRTDTWLRAVPRVLRSRPDTVFVGTGLDGSSEAQNLVRKLGIAHAVRLLPTLPRGDLVGLYRAADVLASITTHDGTPISLLEGMASGCVPVCGDIPSIREWVIPGETGMLVDPDDPESVAEAIVRVLADDAFRARASKAARETVLDRADRDVVAPKIAALYERAKEARR